MKNHSTCLLTKNELAALIRNKWRGALLLWDQSKGEACIVKGIFSPESIGFPRMQEKVLGSEFLFSPPFGKYSTQLVPGLKSSSMRFCQILIKCSAFFSFSSHPIRQCKHQCHLMNHDASLLVPGNNFLLCSTIQRLILAWSLHLIIIF